jgi:hypothetical protein
MAANLRPSHGQLPSYLAGFPDDFEPTNLRDLFHIYTLKPCSVQINLLTKLGLVRKYVIKAVASALQRRSIDARAYQHTYRPSAGGGPLRLFWSLYVDGTAVVANSVQDLDIDIDSIFDELESYNENHFCPPEFTCEPYTVPDTIAGLHQAEINHALGDGEDIPPSPPTSSPFDLDQVVPFQI